ncbi:hypothetical protein E5288_WYG004530 [Bos mutus]|uniref:Uncharacterized protein n=1 Tax=Bos mutus TaxID=72004 RepID=A0A6B0RNR3_9CETA|nr:hypothetical protein [Bos mutus]
MSERQIPFTYQRQWLLKYVRVPGLGPVLGHQNDGSPSSEGSQGNREVGRPSWRERREALWGSEAGKTGKGSGPGLDPAACSGMQAKRASERILGITLEHWTGNPGNDQKHTTDFITLLYYRDGKRPHLRPYLSKVILICYGIKSGTSQEGEMTQFKCPDINMKLLKDAHKPMNSVALRTPLILKAKEALGEAGLQKLDKQDKERQEIQRVDSSSMSPFQYSTMQMARPYDAFTSLSFYGNHPKGLWKLLV